jgi:hypothetical protein
LSASSAFRPLCPHHPRRNLPCQTAALAAGTLKRGHQESQRIAADLTLIGAAALAAVLVSEGTYKPNIVRWHALYLLMFVKKRKEFVLSYHHHHWT